MKLKLKNKNLIKNLISINDIDINKIAVSNKLLLVNQYFEYFIGYKDSKKVSPLCIFRPQTVIYERNFDENRSILKKRKKFLLNIWKF